MTKLCNILFTRELARRAPELRANCFHPGVVRTGFGKNENGIWKLLDHDRRPVLPLPARGARSLVWLALSDEAARSDGAYVVDERWPSPAPPPRTTTSPRACGAQRRARGPQSSIVTSVPIGV